MTEWDASSYARCSALQESMAAEVLALLHFSGAEHILDIGCGDGRITAEISTRVRDGFVVGIDASEEMIHFAQAHAHSPNLRFQQIQAAHLPFENEFDVIVSFNALHWLPDQDAPLRGIHAALKPTAYAQLRLVTDGERKSLETVLEETRRSEKWATYYKNFRDPYLHLTPDQYAQKAEYNGLRVRHLHTASKSWDFHSRENFFYFGQVTFIEWTRLLPPTEQSAFIHDVLDNYAQAALSPHTFHFYQTDVTLTPA